jgi:putative membrane protein
MWWWGYDDGRGMSAGGWIGMAFMILFWLAVVVAIVFLVRYLAVGPSGRSHERSPGAEATDHKQADPLRILETRYAKGEIDREEFLQRRDDLQHRAD